MDLCYGWNQNLKIRGLATHRKKPVTDRSSNPLATGFCISCKRHKPQKARKAQKLRLSQETLMFSNSNDLL